MISSVICYAINGARLDIHSGACGRIGILTLDYGDMKSRSRACDQLRYLCFIRTITQVQNRCWNFICRPCLDHSRGLSILSSKTKLYATEASLLLLFASFPVIVVQLHFCLLAYCCWHPAPTFPHGSSFTNNNLRPLLHLGQVDLLSYADK